MKKVILVLVLAAVAYGAYYFLWKTNDNEPESKPKPLSLSKKSNVFDQSFSRLLNSYYLVKDALVESDTVKANRAASDLIVYSDSLRTEEIEGDTSGIIKQTAKDYAAVINGSAKGLIGEITIEGKRKEFEMITDAMWTLTRTVQYGGSKVYYQYCPMAFNNKGAYWMSNERQIRNPYFGDQMLECGSVEDSLDYSNQ